MKFPTFKHESQKLSEGYLLVAGCDEVGVAPLAGPVVAATVVLDPASIGKQRSKQKWWYRVRDSKTVNEKERQSLEIFIKDHCLDWGVGIVGHETIDEINIYHAAQLAMRKSYEQMKLPANFLFVDGIRKVKNIPVEQKAVVGGDMKILSVAAASIIAKVARDQMMIELDDQFPVYGFMKHKGYPTKFHREALLRFGVSPVHRKSFTFVRDIIRSQCSHKTLQKMHLP